MSKEAAAFTGAVRAAIYARVSTVDQNNTLQLAELTEYVARRGWELVGTYQDHMSGAKASRPGLDTLMADARIRRFDAVLVWKLDRFGRSLINCVSGIQTLASFGIRFLAITQAIDTDQTNPASNLLMHILAAVAEFERQIIRERVSAGMKSARTRGTKTGRAIGRPRKIFNRGDVLALHSGGLSLRIIALRLGISAQTVSRVLSQRDEEKCKREAIAAA